MHGVGGCTIEDAKSRMSAREFEQWRVFYAIRPFGPWQDDYRIAAFNMSIRSMMSDKRLHIRDFMCVAPKKRAQSESDMLNVLAVSGLGLK